MAGTPEVIQAKAFQLVDDSGNVTAELTTGQLGTPVLRLRDQEGTVRLGAGFDENGQPILALYNESMQMRYRIGLDEKSEPVEVLYNGRHLQMRKADSEENRRLLQSQVDAALAAARAATAQASSEGEEPPRGRWWQFWRRGEPASGETRTPY